MSMSILYVFVCVWGGGGGGGEGAERGIIRVLAYTIYYF